MKGQIQMIQELPDISFERNMNHNYLILKKCDFFEMSKDKTTDFRTRMILENLIEGLLPVSHRIVNGESRYYYEINSLQSLDRLYEKKEMKYEELKTLLLGCIKLFDTLEQYLLDGTQIIIKPEFIYLNVESMEPYFVCYPDYTGDVRLSFMEFIDDVLTRIDHTDQRAVMLGYQIYRYTRNQNYVLSEINEIVNKTIFDINKDNYNVREKSEIKYKVPYDEAKDSDNNNSQIKNTHEKSMNNRQSNDLKDSFEIYEGMDYEESSKLSKISNGRSLNKSIMQDEELYNENLYDEDLYHENLYDENISDEKSQKSGSIGDLIGAVISIFIALSGVAMVLGARILMLFKLNGNQELYLYGAIAMAIVAAVLFTACYIKKRRYEKELEKLQSKDFDDCELRNYKKEFIADKVLNKSQNLKVNHNIDNARSELANSSKFTSCNNSEYASNETVCLGSSIVEERMLRGRMDGKEVSISLNQLPVTIGKLASFVDYVINDNAVSKMHARFEEHNGRVYLCDLNSTNGTVKNGTIIDINNPVPLEPGDKLRFGRTSFTYC